MKKGLILLLLSTLALLDATGQIPPHEIARIKKEISETTSDSAKFQLFLELSNGYRFSNIDSALHYAEKGIELSRRIAQPLLEGDAISQRGYIFLEAGEIPKAMQDQFSALAIARNNGSQLLEAWTFNRIGNTYMELGELRKAIEYYKLSKNLFAQFKNTGYDYNEMSNLGNVYEMMGILDSAKFYQQQVLNYSLTNTDRYAITYGEMRERLGNVEKHVGNYDSAIVHYRIGIRESLIDFDYRNLAANYLQLARVFDVLHLYDSGIHYAKQTIHFAGVISWKKGIYEASGLLTRMYKLKDLPDSALKYAELNVAIRDSLLGPRQIQRLQLVTLNEQERQLQLEQEKDDLQNRYRIIALTAVIGLFLLLAIVLWRNNVRKQATNRRLSEQKDQIAAHRNNLEKTLNELKATQAQLIQSEKMASLGELTAGIAHEIQNPLNFVNNFSEVNKELLSEMKEEIEKGNLEDAKSLAANIIDNQDKINQHGKRADAIVKGMLQHSRSSSGIKEPTNINALADEYLKLAYHGLRAKEKTFNVTLKTDFDERIGAVNVIPQDIGRVILNLLNNAFYAVSAKASATADGEYEPTVSVSTKKVGDKVLISIADNGSGIPERVVSKIFQPFFTTKPAGQGTGLGLSLSYDIVKAHRGELKMENKEGEGVEFIIELFV
ncbi:MAG TPA: ATP-binding protein [Chryseolinea sp.]|nr:ATP-binding protein [Chryseolinea sp.]